MALLFSWPVDLVLIIFGLIYALHKYISRNFGYWESLNVPSLKPKPFFGNLEEVFKMKKTMSNWIGDIYEEHKKSSVVGLYLLDRPTLLINDINIIKSVLIRDFNYFFDRNMLIHHDVDPLSAHMLFMSKGDEWRNVRAKLSPAFTSGKLKNMTYLINEVGNTLVKYLDQNAHKPEIDAKDFGQDIFVDVISSCSFGINTNSIVNKQSEFRRHAKSMFEFTVRNNINTTLALFSPTLARLYGATLATKECREFFTEVFETTIEARKSGKAAKRNDLIDIIVQLLEDSKTTKDGYKFDMNLMLSQAFQFFAAGFETSSTTMSFLLYQLCQHQDMQDRVRKEILDALEEHKEFSYDAIQSMKYLDMCFTETTRLYPVLPFLDRQVMEDYRIPELNLTLKKGTPVYIPLYGLHMDPQYYPEPEKFNPERYSPENIENIAPMTLLGFGAGPRNCIGERFARLAIRICLAHILSNYKVIPSENTQSKIVFEKKSALLQAEGGLPMKFVKLAAK